jgi:hypothetical protein
VELYNLKDDLGEQTDLAAKLPEKAQALRTKLAAWRQQEGAQLPTVNPDFDPSKDKGLKKKQDRTVAWIGE